MRKGAFVAKLAVALDEPCTGLFLSTRLYRVMGEGTRRACGACSDFEEFARNMGEVLG